MPAPRIALRTASALAPLVLPAALCAAVLTLCYGGLLAPGRALVSRDIPLLHLPLRSSFKALLAFGHLPGWDPLQHSGQPILSNPHYGAFYPGTWLCLALPPIAAIHVTILLHAILAFAGAWTLTARWGGSRPARAFAAVGYCAGGGLLSLPGILLMFCGMAWLPWALVLAEQSLTEQDLVARPGKRLRGILGLGAVLGVQALNGDPAAVLVTWMAVLALAALPDSPGPETARFDRLRRLRAVGGAIALGLLLASAQALPTWARLRESARGAGLSNEAATQWSTRPLRLAEVFIPRLFGDAARDEEDLYYGAHLHDRNFPFLQSIYPGLLVSILGLAALCAPRRESIPRRRALTAFLLLGLALGLGRFDPLFPVLRAALPFLGALRYPEKFLLLALCGLCFAAALELDRLLEIDVPVALRRHYALLGSAFAAALAAVAFASAARPALEAWIRRSVITPLPPGVATAGARYLFWQWLVSCGLMVASGLWIAGLARGRTRAPWLARAAVVFLLLDLAYYGRGLNPTMPAEALLSPRALERQIAASPQHDDRIFSDDLFQPVDSAGGFRLGEPGTRQIATRLDALVPSTAATLGFGYALHRDFDLMLTSWGRLALAQASSIHDRPDLFRALLAAWNVGTIVRTRSPEEQLAEYKTTRARPLPAAVEPLTAVQPRWRFAAAARFVAAPLEGPQALAGRTDAGAALAPSEILVGEPGPDWTALDPAPRLLQVDERGDRVRLRLQSAQAALLIGALTFDDGWSARGEDGTSLPTWPTALGQLAVLVPPGASVVELRYRDPWVSVGATISLVAVLGALLAAARSRH